MPFGLTSGSRNSCWRGTHLKSLRVLVDLTSFRVEFHCIRKDKLNILGKLGACMVFLPFQFFLAKGVRSSCSQASGNAYEDVFETLRSLDDLVVTRPQFLAGEFHELGRDDASARGTKSTDMWGRKCKVERTRPRFCPLASANAT